MLRPPGKIVGRSLDFGCAAGNRTGILGDIAHGFLQALNGHVEIGPHLFEVGGERLVKALLKIALGERVNPWPRALTALTRPVTSVANLTTLKTLPLLSMIGL